MDGEKKQKNRYDAFVDRCSRSKPKDKTRNKRNAQQNYHTKEWHHSKKNKHWSNPQLKMVYFQPRQKNNKIIIIFFFD